jgi:predicted Zn-dependent protease
LVRSALAALSVAGAAAFLITYDSQRDMQAAYQRFLSEREFHGAVADLRASDSVLNPSVYRDFGIAISLVKTGRPAEGERVMARSARRQPNNVQPWRELARIQVVRGRLAAARASWAHLRRLNPNLPRELPPP